MSIDDKLAKIKYVSDEISHLSVDFEVCNHCENRTCTIVCPANVYEWIEEENKLIINYENCLECGACRIACAQSNIQWAYPKGTSGVTFKYG